MCAYGGLLAKLSKPVYGCVCVAAVASVSAQHSPHVYTEIGGHQDHYGNVATAHDGEAEEMSHRKATQAFRRVM